MFSRYMKRVVEGVPHGSVPLERPAGVHPKMVSFTAGEKQRQALLFFKDGSH